MIQFLAHQHHRPACLLKLPEPSQPFRAKPGTYYVVEVLLAQQVQPVATHAAQRQVHQPGGKLRVFQRHQGSKQTQAGHSAETIHPLGERLGVARIVGRQTERP